MMATLQFTSGYVDITPTNPLPLAGHAGRAGPYAGIADDLEANAVIVQDGDQLLIAITFDLLYVGDWLRRQLERALEPFVQPDHLFLAASHTHFAPATDPALPLVGTVDADFVVMVAGKVEALVRELMHSEFKPLHAGIGRAQAYNAVNRRRIGWRLSRRFPFLRRGVSMAPNPRGIKDETIQVLRLGAEAVIWNYACHPVIVPQMNHISSDFIGVVRRALRAKLGLKTAVLFWQGFSGDVYPSFAATMFGLRQRWYGGNETVAADVWTRWTADLAWHVERAHANAVMRPAVGPMRSVRVSCPVSDLLTAGTSDKALWTHRIHIGPEIDILGVSAEFVTAYISSFRSALASPNLLCVGCIDGVFGYLPTAQMLREGGYEAADFFPHFSLSGKFRDDLEQILRAKLVAPLAL
jgi:hypothetical protein